MSKSGKETNAAHFDVNVRKFLTMKKSRWRHWVTHERTSKSRADFHCGEPLIYWNEISLHGGNLTALFFLYVCYSLLRNGAKPPSEKKHVYLLMLWTFCSICKCILCIFQLNYSWFLWHNTIASVVMQNAVYIKKKFDFASQPLVKPLPILFIKLSLFERWINKIFPYFNKWIRSVCTYNNRHVMVWCSQEFWNLSKANVKEKTEIKQKKKKTFTMIVSVWLLPTTPCIQPRYHNSPFLTFLSVLVYTFLCVCWSCFCTVFPVLCISLFHDFSLIWTVSLSKPLKLRTFIPTMLHKRWGGGGQRKKGLCDSVIAPSWANKTS